ncbi:MAG: ribosomal protection-like ABC-F family protein [Eubacteriales bacterium]
MLAITVSELSMSFGARDLFKNVSFALEENDKLGIIGGNGCGKSTLFKIILGELQATGGDVFIAKNKSVGIVTQDCAFEVSSLTGRSALEQMYSAFPELLSLEAELSEIEKLLEDASDSERIKLSERYHDLYIRYENGGGLDYKSRCAGVLLKMGFDENSLSLDVDLLSGGQRTRLALSKKLCREPDLLLLDEPTNHLDMETVAVLESYIKNYKKCVLVISHDRYFLDRVTNKTLAMENGEAKLYSGNYSASMKQRQIDREIAEKHYINQQKEIARQEAYIAQQRAWNRERNIIAAESRQKLLDKMVRLERPKEAPKPVSIKFRQSIPSGNEVLRAEGLGKSFDSKKLFEGVDFLIRKGERVFIIGKNGSGKSTLMKILVGETEASAGYIEAGYNVEIGYYDQQNHNLTESNTVLDELWNAYPDRREFEIRSALARFRFSAEDCEKTVRMLSGGERARLTLAKLILSPMNFLLLDEPTNHLDIMSREALESALDEFGGTVLIVSHDRYLVNKLATRVFEIDPDRTTGKAFVDYPVFNVGNAYTEYCDFKASHTVLQTGSGAFSAPTAQKEDYLNRKKQVSDARREQRRVEKLRAEAELLEAELEGIDGELYGDAASDYKKAAALAERKEQCEERLLEIYEELEEI